MTRLAIAFIATLALAATAAPANAYEVGDVFKFTESSVGCYRHQDTSAVMLLQVYNSRQAAMAHMMKIQESGIKFLRETGREPPEFCDVVSASSTLQYRVVEVGAVTRFDGGRVLVCVQPILKTNTPMKSPCMWHLMPPRGSDQR